MTSDPPLDRLSDSALLARFAAVRDERAFAQLMARHGPLVLGVCRRLLRQRQDAEDAFQAVFVALSAQARRLRRVRSLAGWLHNVAVRVSCNVLRANRRRRRRMLESHCARGHDLPREPLMELSEVLDQELTALPARYREVLLLCDLEGESRSQAARKLAVPAGTVASRLNRARAALRDRLVKRGVTLSAGGLAATLARSGGAAPPVPVELTEATVQSAIQYLAGKDAGGIVAATKVSSLAQGVLHTMFLTRLSTKVCIVALAAALVLGATPASQMLGLTSIVRAQNFIPFLDDFADGDVSDGIPVKWLAGTQANGTSQVTGGDYVINGTAASRYADVSGSFRDGSVQAQLRFLQSINSTFAYVFARSPTAAAYAGGIRQDGALMIVESDDDGGIQIRAQLATALNPVTRDVQLQLDTIGNSISLTAWHDGDAMPSQPQLALFDDTLTFGDVGIGLAGGGDVSQVAFRQVAAVPEPSSVALGSLGFVALAGLVCRTRLLRIRSVRSLTRDRSIEVS